MEKAAMLLLLLVPLFAAPTQSTKVFRKPSDPHAATGFVQASTGMDQQIRAGITSTSMQDSLELIATMQESADKDASVTIPGQWLTDRKKAFLFLPIKLPKDLPLDDMKLLTNGRELIVNTVSRSAEIPEDEATKKFRLVLAAFKAESSGDEQILTQKLEEWYKDEDEEEVKNLIKKTLDGLGFATGEKKHIPQAIEIPLNTLELSSLRKLIAEHQSSQQTQGFKFVGPHVVNPHGGSVTIRLKGTYLQMKEQAEQEKKTDPTPLGGTVPENSGGWAAGEPALVSVPLDSEFLQKLVSKADYVVPLSQEQGRTSNIQESISVTIPYPVAPGRVFAVLAQTGQVVITMPFLQDSVKATADEAFVRVPVFDSKGDKLIGGAEGGPAKEVLSPESGKGQVKLVKDQKAGKAAANAAKKPEEKVVKKDAPVVPKPNKAEVEESKKAEVAKAAASVLGSSPKKDAAKKKEALAKKEIPAAPKKK